MLAISGKILCPTDKPLSFQEIRIDAFETSLLSTRFDRHLGWCAPSDAGYFEIIVDFDLGINPKKIYLVIADPERRYDSVSGGQNQFELFADSRGNRRWKSGFIDDLNNVQVTISSKRRPPLRNQYEAVVVGSGFGGTIVALSLANKYAESASFPRKSVCVLERGQWWVSQEMPMTSEGTTDGRPTLRENLEQNDAPYGTWTTQDDLTGLLRTIGCSRTMNPVAGLYDFRRMKNVDAISASGVGGGSLIYFNLTARPDPSSYENWTVQTEGVFPSLTTRYSYREVYGERAADYVEDSLEVDEDRLDYFDIATNFIGVNKITTYAGLGRFTLAKTRVFQRTASAVNHWKQDLMNGEELGANLSITDVPDWIFKGSNPTKTERTRLSRQANICQRNGRCGLGCIAEARHTMSERLYASISEGKPIEVFPLCRVEAVEENRDGSGYKYNVFLTDFREDRTAGVKTRIQANIVVLAAGSLGSTEILLKSKTLDTSAALGTRFSTNADTFGIVYPTKDIVDASRGPLLTSIAKYKKDGAKPGDGLLFSIEDLGIPKMFGEVLPAMLDLMIIKKETDSVVPRTNLVDAFRRLVFDKISDPRTTRELLNVASGTLGLATSEILADKVNAIMDDMAGMASDAGLRSQSVESRLDNIMILFGIGRDDSSGRLIVDENDGEISLEKPYDLDQTIFGEIIERMKLFADVMGRDGRRSLVIPFWDESGRFELTAHPLGGCPMGHDATVGVVDALGRVYKGKLGKANYDGLYVADGSIVPTSLGVNPSLTICALAFRIAEEIVGDKRFWPMP